MTPHLSQDGSSVVTSSFFCRMRLGVNLMSWSSICMLAWLFCLGGNLLPRLISFGYAVTWWMTSSRYIVHLHLGKKISLSWFIFSSWCDFVCRDAINCILVWFLFNCILVWFFFLSVGWLFRLMSMILSDLLSFHILVRLIASWCDLCVLGGDIFLYIIVFILACQFSFYTCI